MSLKKLYDMGEKLGGMIKSSGGSDAEVENVCEKLGQYCFMHGIKDEHVDLFYKFWETKDRAITMDTLTFGQWIMEDNHNSGKYASRN